MATPTDETDSAVTGRCYCGAIMLRARRRPRAVAYCHCADCKRVTGAPVAAFACFDEADIAFTPSEGRAASVNPGVTRSFCPDCGSPLTGRYAYLPGQVYVPLGLLDQAGDCAPELHAHDGQRLPWLHIADSLQRFEGSSRARLVGAETAGAGTEGAEAEGADDADH